MLQSNTRDSSWTSAEYVQFVQRALNGEFSYEEIKIILFLQKEFKQKGH